jgi:hypothetical protein
MKHWWQPTRVGGILNGLKHLFVPSAIRNKMEPNSFTTTTTTAYSPSGVITLKTPYTYTYDFPPNYSISCITCQVSFSTGLGGGEAVSQDDATVAAYVHGWYTKRAKICPDCRKEIAPQEKDGEETEKES